MDLKGSLVPSSIRAEKEETEKRMDQALELARSHGYSLAGGGATYFLTKDNDASEGHHTFYVMKRAVWGIVRNRHEKVIDKQGDLFDNKSRIERKGEDKRIAAIAEFALSKGYELKREDFYFVFFDKKGNASEEYSNLFLKKGEIWSRMLPKNELVMDSEGVLYNSPSRAADEAKKKEDLEKTLEALELAKSHGYTVEEQGAVTFLINKDGRKCGPCHDFWIQEGEIWGNLGDRVEKLIDEEGNKA